MRADLTAVYVAYMHMPATDIAGTVAGSVYYAYVPATDTYWAVASFVPTSTAAEQTLVNLQDGGDMGVFTRVGTGAWQMRSNGGIPFPCPGLLPADVSSLWGMTIRPAADC